MELALIATGVVLLGFNIVVSFLVWRSQLFTQRQKILQSLLIWLLPVFGGALTWSVVRGVQPSRFTTDLGNRQGSSVTWGDAAGRLDTDASDIGGVGHDGGGH